MAIEGPKPAPVPQAVMRTEAPTVDVSQAAWSPALEELADALMKTQTTMGKLTYDKEAKAGSFSYKYASLAAVLDLSKEPLAQNGLSVTQFLDGSSLTTMLLHKSGQYLVSRTPLKPFTSKPGAQGVGGGITYARRYALTALLGLAADDDTDASDIGVTVKPLNKGKR